MRSGHIDVRGKFLGKKDSIIRLKLLDFEYNPPEKTILHIDLNTEREVKRIGPITAHVLAKFGPIGQIIYLKLFDERYEPLPEQYLNIDLGNKIVVPLSKDGLEPDFAFLLDPYTLERLMRRKLSPKEGKKLHRKLKKDGAFEYVEKLHKRGLFGGLSKPLDIYEEIEDLRRTEDYIKRERERGASPEELKDLEELENNEREEVHQMMNDLERSTKASRKKLDERISIFEGAIIS